jgi:hypothetical protein
MPVKGDVGAQSGHRLGGGAQAPQPLGALGRVRLEEPRAPPRFSEQRVADKSRVTDGQGQALPDDRM